jgi:ribosome-binding protein aMBF1 (putative translation factor)
MSVRTHEHPTKAVCTLAFVGPADHAEAAREALHALGFEETDTLETVPWREVFPPIPDTERPGRMLRAARTKEGVTQSQLARLTGIPQRHISEMEHGKRSIGKERAKKLAEVLKVDYHILL